MAQTADFRSRIVLEGGEKAAADLKTIGQTGEKSFAQVSEGASKTSRMFGLLAGQSAAASRGLREMRGSLSGLTAGFTSVAGFGTQLKAAFTGLAAFEGLRRSVDIIGGVTEQMQELRNVSASTGFPTDTLRAFQIALEQTGNAGEKVGGMFIQFAGAVGDADKAAAGASNAFTDLGINTKAFQGVNRMNAILNVYIKRWALFQRTRPAVAARSGALAFGEDDVTKLGDILKDIAAVGVPAYVEAMKQFGRFPSKADFAQLKQYEKALGGFRGAINTLKMDAVIALFPGLSAALNNARTSFAATGDTIRAFFVDLGNVLQGKQAQTEFVRNIVAAKDVVVFAFDVMKVAFQQVSNGLDLVAAAANRLFGVQWTGQGIAIALVGLKLVGVFGAVAAAIDLARKAWVVFSFLVIRSPFGALVAGIGVLIAYLLSSSDAAKKFNDSLGQAAPATGQTAQNMGQVDTATRGAAKSAADVLDLTKRATDQTAALAGAAGAAAGATADAAKQIQFANSGMTILSTSKPDEGPHDMAWHERMRSIPNLTFGEVNPQVTDMKTGVSSPVGQGTTKDGKGRLVTVADALGAVAAGAVDAAGALHNVAAAADRAAAAQKPQEQAQAPAQNAAPGSMRALSDQFRESVNRPFQPSDVPVATQIDQAGAAMQQAGSDIASQTEGQNTPQWFNGQTLSEWFAGEVSKTVEEAQTVPLQVSDSLESQTVPLPDWLTNLQSALDDILGKIGRAQESAGAAGLGFAKGGAVPGSGSGDTVPAWLTPGEFVMRKSAVSQLGLPFLSMLNRGMGSFLPRGHYAAGGLVTAGAGGGGTPVHLHLGGQSFALSGGADVVSSLAHEARRYQLRSAGTKPSWYGGTPGGR